MNKKTRIAIVLFAALAIMFTCGSGFSQIEMSEPVATISNSRGIVHCKKGTSRIWKKCGDGDQLYANDQVKTSGGSTAFINFTDGSYMKLLPISRASITKPWEDNPSTLVAVDSGRLWVKMATEQDDAMFLVKTPDGIVRGNNSRAFIEVGNDNKSCIEIADGVAGIISATEPNNEVFVHNRQKVSMATGAIVGNPESINEEPDETLESKSCLPAPEQKQEPGPDAVSQSASYSSYEEIGEDQFVVIKSSINIVFDEKDTGEQIEDSPGMMASTPATYDDKTTAPEEEEEVFLTIVGVANITFTSSEPETTDAPTKTEGETTTAPAEETEGTATTVAAETVEDAGPCEESPVIFDVTVTDEEVDDQGIVTLDSELPCDLNATATIVWNTTTECGAIKSTSVGESNKTPVFFSGANPGQAAGGKLDYPIRDGKPHEMIIKSEAVNGKITFYSFSVKVQGQTSSALPEISGVTINNVAAEEETTFHLGSTSCGDMPFEIKGTAASECGDIKEVELEIDGTDVLVKGKDSWSFSKKYKEDDTFPVIVRATDSSGRKSRDYEIEVELVREITPPNITIDTIGGEEPVTTSGEPMALYRNNLESGKLIVKGSVDSSFCAITKLEASLDEGSSWSAANISSKWEFPFTPSDETEYQISARAFDDAGQESDEQTPIEIIYFKYTLLEKLEMTFKDMMDWYQSENDDDFMEYVLDSFTSTADDASVKSRTNLEQSLQNKFDEQQDIYLNYQTPSYSISGTYGYVIFRWNAHPNSDGNHWHSATFVYSRSGYGWKLAKVEDADTFLRHTSRAAYIEIQPGYMSSLVADREDNTDIDVVVRDSAYNPVKNGTPVKFSASTGTITSPETTVDGNASSTYTAGSFQGIATITVSASEGSAKSQTVNITLLPEPPPGPPTN